jgi:hypothetical protein
VFGVRDNSPGMRLDLALLNLRRKPRTDFWGYAVAMHVPVGPDMAQEPALLQQ